MLEWDIWPLVYTGRSSALQTKQRTCWIQMQNINQPSKAFVRRQYSSSHIRLELTALESNFATCFFY